MTVVKRKKSLTCFDSLTFSFICRRYRNHEKGIFTNAIKTRSREDGSDLNTLFNQIFASLDIANRLSQENWLQEFPYVNGKLLQMHQPI